MKVWKGEKPQHTISVKIDGINARLWGPRVVSRKFNPLYNIDPSFLEDGKIYEVYLGSFEETKSVLSTHVHERKVKKEELYEIYPGTDVRLLLPLDCNIEEEFNKALELGYEGLVIDQEYKLKKNLTVDVRVIGIQPGEGRNLGRMGALITTKGKVGTGFTDKERELDWRIGEIIEVECMEITKKDKMRKARFKRRRFDKDTENFE